LHQNLVHDLDYIDKTYYPDMIHYIKHDEEEGDTDTLKDEEGWSKLTIGEINPKNRLVSSLVIDVSNKSLFKLSSSIGHLNNLTKLDLSKNQLIYLPETLGQLVNLRVLNASKNQLEYLPDSITILPKLKALNVSHNKLSTLPQGIGSLPSLIVLILNHNQFTHLPREIAKLKGMITLNVSHNPLCSIPAEIATLKSLRKLTVEGCSFKTEFMHTRAHDPPRLVEICARQIVKYQIPYPSHLSDYFSRQQTCSFCSGPYFDSFVTRGRFVQRSGRQWIALDERLCCAHWIDEQDRISALFS
ncbi:uncharacterized protein B0P05DRAFT_438202, partial [Gilbertella persicaria]|uniref:uncharacterized protein n=1 Tax=Gilbertella persicaria TaxID=101096 RepID=UPI00221EBCCC